MLFRSVPHVVGLTASEAQTRLEDAGLTVKLADGDYSTKVDEGVVLRAEPAEGVSVKTGSRVTLVLSLGPPPVPVPNVIGLPLADAKEALREAHLKVGEVTKAFNERFEADQTMPSTASSRSEERRVGKECSSPCRSRWSPYH